MKEYRVYADIDGKTKELFIYADRFEYSRDKNTHICTFSRGTGADFAIVALFNNNIKAIICNTEEISKRVLETVVKK